MADWTFSDLDARQVAANTAGPGCCEGPSCDQILIHVECPAGQIISDVVTVFYGRSNNVTCGLAGDPATTTQYAACAADNAAVRTAVDAACLNRTACDVSASHTALGVDDPCSGTYKCLTITFNCAPGEKSTTNQSPPTTPAQDYNCSSESPDGRALQSACLSDLQSVNGWLVYENFYSYELAKAIKAKSGRAYVKSADCCDAFKTFNAADCNCKKGVKEATAALIETDVSWYDVVVDVVAGSCVFERIC
ncbi:hypothetical protein FOA52_013803 [Chlamydomonas sp. UWO 241]|nr:hypothetical protein FOA52_013803 [Chlamydomonas sp. UWO 241]